MTANTTVSWRPPITSKANRIGVPMTALVVLMSLAGFATGITALVMSAATNRRMGRLVGPVNDAAQELDESIRRPQANLAVAVVMSVARSRALGI